MSSENSLSPKNDLAARLALLQSASDGRLDGLSCPRCQRASVSVYFTRRGDNDYWTWFLCADCAFEMRAQGGLPAHYSRQRERPPSNREMIES
ncbi:MAG: hypothetical protein ACRELG_23090 [Gemmataceae bacterium]